MWRQSLITLRQNGGSSPVDDEPSGLFPFSDLYTNATEYIDFLVEESDDLPGRMLPPSLLMVHNPGRGCENDVAELTGGKEFDHPLLKVRKSDVVSRRDDAGLVESRDTSARIDQVVFKGDRTVH